MTDMDGNLSAKGWKRDRNRGMIVDKTGRFRVFRAQRSGGTVYYILEDRKDGKSRVFEHETLAVLHAEQVKELDAKRKWAEERKRKIKSETEFRHVTAAGGFYYWKPGAAKKWREQKCK